MNFLPFVILWILLGVTVLSLLIWRKAVSSREDDNLHVMDGGSLEKTAQQAVVSQRLDLIDKWGKIMTVVAVLYGVILGVVYALQVWAQNTKIGV